MVELPVERMTPSRPFSKVGLDYAGPLIMKPNVPKSKTKLKSYICVFVCMSTKAVPLEAVSDLSSAAFLAALKRFVERRGLPSDVYSDNGKNFKGVANYLKQLFQIIRSETIQNFATSHFIHWHFIPPYSPHFGGLWESAVKLTKAHLIKACKTTILNFEELTTLLCQIEACLNSRPLTPLFSDPSDDSSYSRSFYHISPILEIPERENSSNLTLSSRWTLIQQMKQEFWKRWSRDYLHHLQNRPKWITPRADLKIGDLVVIHDPQAPPLQWKLGRINCTHPGPALRIRVVSIRTQDGEIQRPISTVTLLLPAGENVQVSQDYNSKSCRHRVTPETGDCLKELT
ncbi:integrase catalytic domain-containing protein [Trichonephila clavipes]|uniref:Integrase catalytic domain-containing protein n=1 Tax=Trichonephila clavipes TaxID=2585209 RepID=A0A8X6W0D0_TRICX|nr:integrase catalytic domain-containing protein [Trichonephila clavipes]